VEARSIAVDGPSGAGKSTLSKAIAKEFNLIHVDTGALYRAIGLFCVKRGLPTLGNDDVVSLLPQIEISLKFENGVQRIFLLGEDVSEDIRLPEVAKATTNTSKLPEVRAFLTETQRQLARDNDVIMDGRDIGTVILPNAGLKVFITASPEKRAMRRYLEQTERGVYEPFADVLKNIIIRDTQDSTRKEAPLKKADDAVLFDTSELTLRVSFEKLKTLVSERFGL